MCLAGALITVQEAMAKYLGESLPVMQVIGMRYLGHFILMVLVFMPRHGFTLIKAKRPLVQIGRSFLLLIDTALYFFALTMIGLAEATAIFFTVPLLVALLSIVFLGERADWGRLIAVLIGFAGFVAIGLSFTIIKYAVILGQDLSWGDVWNFLWIVIKISGLLALGLVLLAYLGSRRIEKQIG